MKRFLTLAAVLTILGCSLHDNKDPYESPFYAKYLGTGSALDSAISRTLEALRSDPDSPALHNDLGQLLVEKGFPKDAEREFERAVNEDGHYYPAWYNLGLIRAANDDNVGARRALYRTIHYKPGHAAALFQLGLIEEKRGNKDRAIAMYAKAFHINRSLLDVRVNPRILDSKLTDIALITLYPKTHTKQSMQFNPSVVMLRNATDEPPTAASPEQQPASIVTPVPPATDQGAQRPVPPGE